MFVAISTEGISVSEHFGRCPSFTIAEVDDNRVVSKEVIDNPGHNPGFLPEFLHKRGVSCIIAGGMGQRAKMLFDEKGIKTVTGVLGDIDAVLDTFASGNLQGGSNSCVPKAGKGYGLDKTVCDHD